MKIPELPANEVERLASLTSYQVLDTLPEPAFDALTRLAAHILGVPIALVSLVDADRQWFKSHHGLDIAETPRDVSFCGHVVASSSTVVVEDAEKDERFYDNPLVTGDPRIRFYVGIPLRSPDGFVIGTLCGIDARPRMPSAEQLSLLELLARQTMDQLELRRTARRAAEQDLRMHAILDTAFDVIVSIDEQGVIESCNAAVEPQFGHAVAELVGQNVRILMPPELREAHSAGLARYLRTGERRVIGATHELTAQRKDGSTFPVDAMVSETQLGTSRLFTGVLRDATERVASEKKLEQALSALDQSHRHLSQVLNALDCRVLVVGADRKVVFANDTLAAAAGVAPQDAVGRVWDDLLRVDQPTRDAIRTTKQAPVRERRRLTVRTTDADDTARWLDLDVRDDPTDPERCIFFMYDVSSIVELRARLAQQRADQLLGDSEPMRRLLEEIEQVATGDWTVLIEGETGSGKELVARAVHAASTRRSKPFIAVNCAALTDSLLGSQLFGHVKGAFTGAVADQPGLFESANGGTLFLDEIGDISAPLQAALLRVLQEREIVRVGEARPRKVDTRVVCATHRDLRQRVDAGLFREDLLYRIRSARVRVPALRERRDDIPLLAQAVLAQLRIGSGKLVADIAPDALQRLTEYAWPGNVRELRGAIEHSVVRCRGRRIEVEDLPPEVVAHETHGAAGAAAHSPADDEAPAHGSPLARAASAAAPAPADDERARIIEALARTGGNRARAARLLGVGRATLYRRLDELGLHDVGRGEAPAPPRDRARVKR